MICGTTTLGAGVNYPITTVIVETLKKGTEDLTYSDFVYDGAVLSSLKTSTGSFARVPGSWRDF